MIAPATHHVVGVIFFGSNIQMTSLDAQRKVTPMQNTLQTRDRPFVNSVSNPMNPVTLSANVNPAIAVRVNLTQPNPTPSIGFRNGVPLQSISNPIPHF